jgi:hypothetical protein
VRREGNVVLCKRIQKGSGVNNIMTIEDFNSLPEGTELNYKSGGYGWWIGDEECGPRGGRQINGSLMVRLHQLGVGMGPAMSVASHQTRFCVETKHVDVGDLVNAIDALEEIWHDRNIKRGYELRDVEGVRMTDYSFPRCHWARGRGWEDKAFRYMGHRWVYGRAQNLKDMPRNLNRIRLCMAGRDLAAESRAEMRAVA